MIASRISICQHRLISKTARDSESQDTIFSVHSQLIKILVGVLEKLSLQKIYIPEIFSHNTTYGFSNYDNFS